MTTILCAMPESTYRRMGLAIYEPTLQALGDVVRCLDADGVTADQYGSLWEAADAVVTGWGARAPSRETLANATHLRVISHTAGSVRWLPRYALERGIIVTNAQAAIARSVAEYCLMHALMRLRAGSKRPAEDTGQPPRTETLYEKTVGLVGYGHVGQLFRALLAPFRCRVLVSDPAITNDQAARAEVERVDLPTLLQNSRVVSLHAPDIPSTHGMIGAAELGLLADGALLLNSARGRLVDTSALTQALRTGRIEVVLDVTDPEPLPMDHPLRSMPNVVITPHVAGPTDDELPQMTQMALSDLTRVLRGEPPRHPVTTSTYDLMSY